MPQLVLVLGRHHNKARHRPKVRVIQNAVVCGAVSADHAAAVESKGYIESHQDDVVIDLVVCPLQEGGVDRGDWPHTLGSQAGGKSDCVLLGNGRIESAVRENLHHFAEACAVRHRGGDGHDLFVGLHQLDCSVGKNCGIG